MPSTEQQIGVGEENSGRWITLTRRTDSREQEKTTLAPIYIDTKQSVVGSTSSKPQAYDEPHIVERRDSDHYQIATST